MKTCISLFLDNVSVKDIKMQIAKTNTFVCHNSILTCILAFLYVCKMNFEVFHSNPSLQLQKVEWVINLLKLHLEKRHFNFWINSYPYFMECYAISIVVLKQEFSFQFLGDLRPKHTCNEYRKFESNIATESMKSFQIKKQMYFCQCSHTLMFIIFIAKLYVKVIQSISWIYCQSPNTASITFPILTIVSIKVHYCFHFWNQVFRSL